SDWYHGDLGAPGVDSRSPWVRASRPRMARAVRSPPGAGCGSANPRSRLGRDAAPRAPLPAPRESDTRAGGGRPPGAASCEYADRWGSRRIAARFHTFDLHPSPTVSRGRVAARLARRETRATERVYLIHGRE